MKAPELPLSRVPDDEDTDAPLKLLFELFRDPYMS